MGGGEGGQGNFPKSKGGNVSSLILRRGEDKNTVQDARISWEFFFFPCVLCGKISLLSSLPSFPFPPYLTPPPKSPFLSMSGARISPSTGRTHATLPACCCVCEKRCAVCCAVWANGRREFRSGGGKGGRDGGRRPRELKFSGGRKAITRGLRFP